MGKGARNRKERKAERQAEAARFHLTEPQYEAMIKEIDRQLLIFAKKYYNDMDAITLLALHVTQGYGPKKLKEIYRAMHIWHNRLITHYEMDPETGDDAFYCTRRLKEIGIDIEEWSNEP